MLRLTLEIVPFGQEACKRSLGTVEISNIGGTIKHGNYRVQSLLSLPTLGGMREECLIKRYPRDKGAWKLVQIALKKLSRGVE